MVIRRPGCLVGIGVAALCSLSVWAAGPADAPARVQTPAAAPASSGYVGSPACERCHEQEYGSWTQDAARPDDQADRPGHHRRATFGRARSSQQYGRAYTMETRDGRYFISVAENGAPRAETFEVNYTLGARRFQGISRSSPTAASTSCRFLAQPDEALDRLEGDHADPRRSEPRAAADLERHLRQLPRDEPRQALRHPDQHLQDDVDRDGHRVRGVPRPRARSHRADGRVGDGILRASRAYDSSEKNHGLSALLRIFSPRTATTRQVFDACGYCHGNKNNSFFGFKPGDKLRGLRAAVPHQRAAAAQRSAGRLLARRPPEPLQPSAGDHADRLLPARRGDVHELPPACTDRRTITR